MRSRSMPDRLFVPLFFSLLALSLLSLPAFRSTAAPRKEIRSSQHAQVREALARHDLATVERLLREMERADAAGFARNNYDYLLARALDRRGSAAEAAGAYRKVVARNSALAGYALWHQAELARAAGKFAEEQTLLQRFTTEHPAHLLRARALERLSASYFRTGQYQAAITALKALSGTRGASARDALVRIGEAQMALKQPAAARATFETALADGYTDDAALRASAGLDQLDETVRARLTEAEHLRRARIYHVNRAFAEARRHWLALVNEFPQSARRHEALFQLGRGYFLEDKFTEAIRWYEQVHKEFPTADEGEQGFYYVGHCYQYLNDADRAIARYEAFLKAYPRSDYIGTAHLNAIDTLRAAGRNREALEWAARAQANVRDPFIVMTALFHQARIHLAQDDFAKALADFTALRARNLNLRGVVATTNAAEVAFMRAYCLEKLGRFEEAVSAYLAMAEGRNSAPGYYGIRASERLRALGANARAKNLVARRLTDYLDQARAAPAQGNAATAKAAATQALRLTADAQTRGEMLKILRAAYAKLPGYQLPSFTLLPAGRTALLGDDAAPAKDHSHQTLADELLFLGLYDEGTPELIAANGTSGATGTGGVVKVSKRTRAGQGVKTSSAAKARAVVRRQDTSRDWAYSLAVYSARGDHANRAIKFAEPLFNSVPDDYRPELLPRELAEMLYPVPYRDALLRHALPRNVDPRIVLSIARQESRFDPLVKSNAAARGLLQFISSTSTQIATQLWLSDFEQDDLYDPKVAILFGAQYLQNLFAEFQTPQAAAAAYNGSEISVRRWLARARSPEVDRFVIEVGKKETKDYVFKVMNSFWAYQAIYPDYWAAK
jgi:soluble lytic murein transglycosylase